MNNNYIISKMTNCDIDEVINLQLSSNKNILSKASMAEDLSKDNSIYFVAKKDNVIIGYIAANLLYDHIDILGVLVDINYLKQGIASNLLTKLLDYAKEKNIQDIFLEVRITNIAAQKLYEKFNFKKISVRKSYYTDNLEDALIYRLSI